MSKIVEAYVAALNNDHGRSFSQIQNLLANEIQNINTLQEILWANQSIIIYSNEDISKQPWNDLWKTQIEPTITDPLLNKIYWNRVNNRLNSKELENIALSLCSELNQKKNFWAQEQLFWVFHIAILKMNFTPNLKIILKCVQDSLQVNYDLLNFAINQSLIDAIQKIEDLISQKITHTDREKRILRSLLIKKALVTSILRIIYKNLPFANLMI